jgi:hypothetical protein
MTTAKSRSRLRQALLTAADLIGKLWTLPNTLAGLLLGGTALLFGARVELAHNAVVFNRFPVTKRAFTLGNTILNPHQDLSGLCPTYGSASRYRACRDPRVLEWISLGAHEKAHTLQYQALGPFFLPLYALSQLWPTPTPFEHAADVYARTGQGWWPLTFGRPSEL